jgi:hypothetical protein
VVGYSLLAVWLEAILPNENGVWREPWYFLRPAFWCHSQVRHLASCRGMISDENLPVHMLQMASRKSRNSTCVIRHVAGLATALVIDFCCAKCAKNNAAKFFSILYYNLSDEKHRLCTA